MRQKFGVMKYLQVISLQLVAFFIELVNVPFSEQCGEEFNLVQSLLITCDLVGYSHAQTWSQDDLVSAMYDIREKKISYTEAEATLCMAIILHA